MNDLNICSFGERRGFKNPILSKIQNGAYKFFYSNYFFILMALVIVLSWKLEIVELAFVFVCTVSAITWFFMDDISPFIACFFCIPYIFPLDIHVENYLHIIPLLIPVVAGVIFHIFYYSPKKFVRGKYLFPQLAVCIALIMGGLGSNALPSEYFNGIGQIVQLGPLLLLIYMACANYMIVRGEEQTIYFSKMFITTSIILTIEMFMVLFLGDVPYNEIEFINLGIVNANGATSIIMICIPFCFYMMVKRPKWTIPLLLFIALQYLVVLCSYSRGGIIFTLLMLPFNVIYTIIKSPRKKLLGIVTGIVILGIIIAGIVFRDKIVDLAQSVIKGLGEQDINEFSSGRIEIWLDGWKSFKQYPAFGVGVGHIGQGYTPGLSGSFWYHSTIIQVIANTGIFGTLLYIYNYYFRFKIVCSKIKQNPFKVFALFGMLGFEGYALINNGTFLAIPAMLMITVMTFMCERTDSYIKYIEG